MQGWIVSLLIRNSIKLIFSIVIIFLLSSCVHDEQFNSLHKKNIHNKINNHELIVSFAKNKTALEKTQENKLISSISAIKQHKHLAARIWISSSSNSQKRSLNLSWLRLKKLNESVYPFIEDIELFYDGSLEQDTALISISWENK